MTFPNPKLRFRRILTLEILLVAGYHLLGVLAGQEEPLGGVAQIVILHGQILGEDRSQIRRRQAVGEGTKEARLGGMLVPVETISGREYIIVELHHGQDGGVQQVDILLHRAAGGLEDSADKENNKQKRHTSDISCRTLQKSKNFN